MFKKLIETIGKPPEYVGKIKDNLEAHHFEPKEVRTYATVRYKVPIVLIIK